MISECRHPVVNAVQQRQLINRICGKEKTGGYFEITPLHPVFVG
jgi:hypothetical protein